MPTTIYRIVEADPATDLDYLTYAERGMPVRSDHPDAVRWSRGYSCFLTFADARRKGKGLPWKGEAFIAEYELADDTSFVLEQTTDRESHYTLWCDAAVLRAGLVRITPIWERKL